MNLVLSFEIENNIYERVDPNHHDRRIPYLDTDHRECDLRRGGDLYRHIGCELYFEESARFRRRRAEWRLKD